MKKNNKSKKEENELKTKKPKKKTTIGFTNHMKLNSLYRPSVVYILFFVMNIMKRDSPSEIKKMINKAYKDSNYKDIVEEVKNK